VAGAAIVLYLSGDPFYTLHEWLAFGRYHRFDAAITEAGKKYNIDPMLLKAVIWRESAFQHYKVGRDGERGLMQVMEGAAKDWSSSQKVGTLQPDDLFDPKTNIEVGAWYLNQSLKRYSGKDDPIPFALAEYNAGRQRMNRWIGENNLKEATANEFQGNISFPGTKSYVQEILARYNYYKAQGHM
jgi:soluble lytic murein transglycosylase